MSQAPISSPVELVTRRVFHAPIEKVFHAWTDPEALDAWFAPSEEFTVQAAVDLRIGGAYRVIMRHANGRTHVAAGTYREIQAPTKLVFTWQWESAGEGNPQLEDTLVTIEFRGLGEKTEVILTHEMLPSMEERDKHEHGWTGCLNQLAKYLL